MAGGRAVVNMAIATSYASIYRDCSEEAEKRNTSIPLSSWFLLQFWPCSRTVSNIMHYTGKFKIRRMVQTRLFRKHNSDSHYCNAIYNFMKEPWPTEIRPHYLALMQSVKFQQENPIFLLHLLQEVKR